MLWVIRYKILKLLQHNLLFPLRKVESIFHDLEQITVPPHIILCELASPSPSLKTRMF